MVRRNNPCAVGLALDAGARSPHGLEPPDVSFGEGRGYARVMSEVDVDGVTTAIGCRDIRDGAIDRPRLGPLRRDGDDGALRRRLGRIRPSDVDVTGPTVNAVDDQVVPVVEPVREPARHDAADQPPAHRPPPGRR